MTNELDPKISEILGREIGNWASIPNAGIRRFASLVDRSDRSGGCWIWIGSSDGGYGMFYYGNKKCRAHRMSYALFKGETPSGLDIHHVCTNPICVNPDHLELVTPHVHARYKHPNLITAKQREATHCKNGHELQWIFDGKRHRRHCQICKTENIKRIRRAERAANPLPEQTHCKRGHEFTEANTYIHDGKRQCKACHNANYYAWRKRKISDPDYKPSVMGPDRTECRRGHALTPDNVYEYRGVKMCRACRWKNHLDHVSTSRPDPSPRISPCLADRDAVHL